jgi:hypothetical protein
MVVLECSVNSLRRYSEKSLAALSLCHRKPRPSSMLSYGIVHYRNLKVMAPIERQASEAKLAIEYTSSTSPIASTTHQTSEPPAQARTDISVGPPDKLRDRASDSLRDDGSSSVEAHKTIPSSNLHEKDSTKLTEPKNAGEDMNTLATSKQTHKYVQRLKKEEQDQACLALSTSQILRNDAKDSPENRYHYSPLPEPGSIRLLRLIPSDENAHIECQLFDYPLQELGEGTHLYEALSYAWGDSNNLRSIFVNEHSLPITTNLHSALLCLRNRFIDRILWVDALCIHQNDNEEKGQQIRLMAEIYSKASRVIIWLGEAEKDSDLALEKIHLAADDPSANFLDNELSKQAIRTLLQRPWFKRIWVRYRHLTVSIYITNKVDSGTSGGCRRSKYPNQVWIDGDWWIRILRGSNIKIV